MNKILKQIVKTCNLIQNDNYSFCYEPICAYEYTGTMLSYNKEQNNVGIAEFVTYSFDNNTNTPIIMFCGFIYFNLDTNNYTNIIQHINDLIIQLRSCETSIKQSLINEQLELVKKDF